MEKIIRELISAEKKAKEAGMVFISSRRYSEAGGKRVSARPKTKPKAKHRRKSRVVRRIPKKEISKKKTTSIRPSLTKAAKMPKAKPTGKAKLKPVKTGRARTRLAQKPPAPFHPSPSASPAIEAKPVFKKTAKPSGKQPAEEAVTNAMEEPKTAKNPPAPKPAPQLPESRPSLAQTPAKPAAQPETIKQRKPDADLLKTPVDDLLRLLVKEGEIRITEAASHFDVSEETIENWGRILEEHMMAELHYPAFGKPSLRATRYKPKKKAGRRFSR